MRYYLKAGQKAIVNTNFITGNIEIISVNYNSEYVEKRVQALYEITNPPMGMKKKITCWIPLDDIIPLEPNERIIDLRVFSYCLKEEIEKAAVANSLNEIVVNPMFAKGQKIAYMPEGSRQEIFGEIILIEIKGDSFLYTLALKEQDTPVTCTYHKLIKGFDDETI